MARRELDDEGHSTVVMALSHGHFLESAAALAGYTAAQVRTWIRLGLEDGSAYEDFSADCRRATAQAEDLALEALSKAAAGGDLRAVTWWLERRHPARWGQKVRHVVQQELDGVLGRVESLAGELGEEVIERVLAAIAGVDGAGAPEGASESEVH